MADIPVSPRRIINRTSDLLFRCQRQLSCHPVNVVLNLLFDLCLHLMALFVDHLDPVIIIGIVACRNHNAAVKILCPYHIGYAGRGSDMEQICVRPGCRQPGRQRVLEHVTASSGVFSDDDSCFVLLSKIPAQVASHFECMLYGQDNIGFSPEAVSSKIFSHFFYLLILKFAIEKY